MKNFIFMIFVFYLLSCAFLYLMQRSLLYFPTPSTVISGVQTITFNSNGEILNGWVTNPGQSKALIYYGGNAEQIEQNIFMFEQEFSEYSVYLISYRGYGHSTGSPSETGLYQDALTIYDQVVQQHDQIDLFARSLGTGIATYVATLRNVRKLVLVTPFDSIERVAQDAYKIFPVRFLLKDKYDSIGRVADIKAQVLILIAGKDEVIPRQHSENLKNAFTAQQVKTVIIPQAYHNDISSYSLYAGSIVKFLKD